MCAQAHSSGALGEQLACEYLEEKGLCVVERNYRMRGGEIDIIARDGADTVFVEVKLRSSSQFGYPEEAVSSSKMKRIAKAIRAYLQQARIHSSYIRFDIIAIIKKPDGTEVHHIQNVELPYTV